MPIICIFADGNIAVILNSHIMKKYSLTVGYYASPRTYVIDDLSDVYQLYGAMHSVVESGKRLVNVSVSDCD